MPRRLLLLLTAAVVASCSACSGSSVARRSAPSPSADGSTARSPASPAATGSAPLRLRASVAPWRLPAARSREVVLAGPHGVVVAGGLDSGQTTTSTVWLLDPATGRLRGTGRLATGVHDATGFVLRRTAYVVAGGNTTTVDDVQRIAAGLSSSVVGRLPRPRSDLVAGVAGGAAYVLAGFDGTASLSEVLRTTDGRRFTTIARLPVTVRYPALAVVGARLLVFGGEHDGVVTDDVQQVDVDRHTARVVGHLPVPLAHEAAFVLDGSVWLAGGRSHALLQSRIWRWEQATRSARRAGRLPYAVADAGCAVVGSTAFIVGGEIPAPTSRVLAVDARS